MFVGASDVDGSNPGIRPRRLIVPTAKVTDVSNSSKPALKSHKAAADAQRAVEAQKAAELKAQQAAGAAADSADTNVLVHPLDTPPISLSRSSSQVLPSQNTSPGTQPMSSDDEPEESV